jgi:hypothetical protein
VRRSGYRIPVWRKRSDSVGTQFALERTRSAPLLVTVDPTCGLIPRRRCLPQHPVQMLRMARAADRFRSSTFFWAESCSCLRRVSPCSGVGGKFEFASTVPEACDSTFVCGDVFDSLCVDLRAPVRGTTGGALVTGCSSNAARWGGLTVSSSGSAVGSAALRVLAWKAFGEHPTSVKPIATSVAARHTFIGAPRENQDCRENPLK